MAVVLWTYSIRRGLICMIFATSGDPLSAARICFTPGNYAAAANSATISLFTRCTVPLPTPTIRATFRMPLPAFRCLLMAPSVFGDTFGRPSFLPCWRTRSRPARTLLRMICRSC